MKKRTPRVSVSFCILQRNKLRNRFLELPFDAFCAQKDFGGNCRGRTVKWNKLHQFLLAKNTNFCRKLLS